MILIILVILEFVMMIISLVLKASVKTGTLLSLIAFVILLVTADSNMSKTFQISLILVVVLSPILIFIIKICAMPTSNGGYTKPQKAKCPHCGKVKKYGTISVDGINFAVCPKCKTKYIPETAKEPPSFIDLTR